MSESNITPNILEKIGRDLHKTANHPICIVKNKIFDYFNDLPRIDIDSPYISTEYNFDKLLVPKNHPCRSKQNTFYKDNETILRTHMTGYLPVLGKSKTGNSQLKYIICGDVYRKDAIDATHYPIFYQIDAFCMVPNGVNVKMDLRNRLEGLVKHLFGPQVEYQFLEDYEHEDVYFPFTTDSLEISVKFKMDNGEDKHLEILGAGTVHPDIMKELGLSDQQAWAFGMGLDRLTMIMFGIPDIRLLWSQDLRFMRQFHAGQTNKFKAFSKQEACYKDISFFLGEQFTYNDMCTIARDEDSNNLIESIVLIDEYHLPKGLSQCYRITYRSMDITLKNSEVNKIQAAIIKRLVLELGIVIR
jgi:phenylalanyl-tRNA synthetase alpha chain